jgi:NAD(P)-dependent dehydrogenase (short-subunit alcohol dehydrogenase family)
MKNAKKIALVTGANRGLGLETARQLGQKGVHVLLAARDLSKGKEAAEELAKDGIETDVVKLEVTRHEDQKAVYRHIDKTYGRLDILVNNAGVFLERMSSPNQTSKLSEKTLRETFDSNFFGVVSLTQTLLPLIRNSEAGRIVNLSSILGSLGLHAQPGSSIYESKSFAYDASKTALNAFTIHLAHELKDTNIKVNSAHPGWVKTDMGGPNATMKLSEGAKTSVALALLDDNGPTGGFFHLGESLPW